MTLSPQEIQQVKGACERATKADLGLYGWYGDTLSNELYSKLLSFYFKGKRGQWSEWGNWSEDYETRQNERIMALLFFVAAGGEL
jgi:putative salt-induced outer membrane protein YdiY